MINFVNLVHESVEVVEEAGLVMFHEHVQINAVFAACKKGLSVVSSNVQRLGKKKTREIEMEKIRTHPNLVSRFPLLAAVD